jgi:hypothetical protein
MSTESASAAQHPAPHRNRVTTFEALFGLCGGATAWFVQFCVGYGVASTPCFVEGTRVPSVGEMHEWMWYALIIATVAGLAVALLALWSSWRALQRTKEEASGGHGDLMEVGSGRTRFIALWGVYLSAGFSIVMLMTFIAYATLPRCVA